MTNPKTKPKFQSQEDYLRDYDAYKHGFTYKIIINNELAVFSRVAPARRHHSIYVKPVVHSFQVVDLKHKFRNIL